MLTCNHHVIWEDFRILGSESNKFLLKLKESSFIKRDKSPILGTNSLYYYSSLPFWILKSYVTFATFGCFRKYPTIFDKPPEVFCKKGILKNVANFTGKHLCWSVFLIKLQAWRLAVSKLSTLTDVFPCKSCKLLRTPTLKNICDCFWLILIVFFYYHLDVNLKTEVIINQLQIGWSILDTSRFPTM